VNEKGWLQVISGGFLKVKRAL